MSTHRGTPQIETSKWPCRMAAPASIKQWCCRCTPAAACHESAGVAAPLGASRPVCRLSTDGNALFVHQTPAADQHLDAVAAAADA